MGKASLTNDLEDGAIIREGIYQTVLGSVRCETSSLGLSKPIRDDSLSQIIPDEELDRHAGRNAIAELV